MTQSKNTKPSDATTETPITPATGPSVKDKSLAIKLPQLALPTKDNPAKTLQIATTEKTAQGDNLQIEPVPTPTENPTKHESKHRKRNNSLPN